jgi:hypothetical protein
MKMFKKTAIALALTAATGMSYAAGTIDIRATGAAGDDADQTFAAIVGGAAIDGTGPVYLDELLATPRANNVDLATIANVREITYTPNTTIGENSTITFEVANGAIDTANGAQLSDDAIGTTALASLLDFTEGTNGYTTLRFQVESGESLAAGDAVYLTTAAATTAAVALTVVADAGLTAGDAVTIEAVSAQDPSAIPITQGTAPAETLISVVDGVDLAITVATSTINVEADPSRSLFVNEPAGDTSTTTSTAEVTFNNNAEIAPDFTTDNYTLAVTRDNIDGVDSIEAVSGATQALTLADGVYTLAGNNFDSANDFADGVATDLVITVNGTDVLATGDWTASLTVNDDPATGAGDVVLATNATSHTWDINGAQFKIPYHAQNVSGFNFFFNAVNETSINAEVFADVIVQNISQGTSVSLTNVNLGDAIAESSTTFGQGTIKTAINAAAADTINDADVYHVAMTLTAIAPANDVHVAAFQKDAIGRTVVPVLVNTGARDWQQ